MIPLFKVHMPPREILMPALERTLFSGYVTEGPKVKEFEGTFGTLVSSTRIIAVNSGTSALTLALRLAGVGESDYVITTPMTCTATNLPILSLGAQLIFADVDPQTGLIDPNSVHEILHRPRPQWMKIKAVVCVDWGGAPCNLTALDEIVSHHGVLLIEDAAHALGAEFDGRPVGSELYSDFSCFSLQAIKHVTTIDGGMISLGWRRQAEYERGKRLRWFGIDRESRSGGDSRIDLGIEEWGWKFHMNDVTATIGIEQLPFLPGVVRRHRDNAQVYHDLLSDYFVKPRDPEWARSAYWLYTILLPTASERDGFRDYMLKNGVQVSRVHRRNDEYAVFREYGGRGERGRLPGVDRFSDRMICIPVHWGLSRDDVLRVVELCNEWVEGGLGA